MNTIAIKPIEKYINLFDFKIICTFVIESHSSNYGFGIFLYLCNGIKCKIMSDALLNEYGIYIQPINYPTVAAGEERLRIAPTPLHTDAMMSNLVEALRKVFND